MNHQMSADKNILSIYSCIRPFVGPNLYPSNTNLFLKPKWSPHTLKAYVVHANKFEDCDEFHSVFRQQPKRQDSRSGQVQGPQSASLEVLFYDSL